MLQSASEQIDTLEVGKVSEMEDVLTRFTLDVAWRQILGMLYMYVVKGFKPERWLDDKTKPTKTKPTYSLLFVHFPHTVERILHFQPALPSSLSLKVSRALLGF